MNVLNRDDVQRALDNIVGKTSWNADAIIDEAEKFAMENGYTDRNFAYEDGDAEYCFECVKPETYVYDEDGELDCGNDDSEYWLWLIRDKKTGSDIYRKSAPQYEEMFKGTRKASANKAQGVKADEKKEVFVYKAMDVNGNGVFKVFYDDGTYEILKGGRAYERSFGDYDKFVSMETLRHATAPPKGKARKASAQKVKAAQDGWTYYEDLTHEEQEIYLYAENDGRLYESKTKPIMRNIARKINNGTYDKDKAVVAWEYLVKDAIAKYNKEFDDEQIRLNPASRKRVAQVLADSYEDEVNDMAKEMKSGRKNANRGAQRARKVKAALSKEKVIEIAENLYWGVRDYGDVVEFEFSSPAGEDFVFSVDADNVADNVWEYAQNFDAEEHAREVMDMPGAPSLRELLEDADEIKRELELLADEIWGAEVDKIRMEDVESSVRRKSGARRVAKKPVNAYLKIISDLSDYQPWSGAVETYERIKDAGMLDDFEMLMEDTYPEGLTMTQLNDILWFEPEWVYQLLGMNEDNDYDDEYDEYED